jgi:hypothetical protein
MDPYVERTAIWSDFHDRLIASTQAALQPLLRPRYVALIQERLYVLESDRAIRPDVAVVRTASKGRGTPKAAVLELDTPIEFDLWREETREPVIHIIEPAAENRLIAAIEVLSPINKGPGPGRDSYLKNREEFWGSGTNLAEVDLLREGQPTVRLSDEDLAELPPFHYLVAVTRHWPCKQQVYPVSLRRRLPRVAIPLAFDDTDVRLDLHAVFSRTWEDGPYPEVLRYEGPPPGFMSPKDVTWCEKLLNKSGFRQTTRPRQSRRSRGKRSS